jgi:hypothetical protein
MVPGPGQATNSEAALSPEIVRQRSGMGYYSAPQLIVSPVPELRQTTLVRVV